MRACCDACCPLSDSSLADTLTAADFGLSGDDRRVPSLLARVFSRRAPLLSYSRVHVCAAYSVGIFLLRAGASIPLHNHPDMTVFTRVLSGRLRLASFDWLPSASHERGGEARRVHLEQLEGPAPTRHLGPASGNLHELHADTDCAILDVLSPPYSAAQRPCQYYKLDAASNGGGVGSIVTLLPIPQPPGFRVDGDVDRAHLWPA